MKVKSVYIQYAIVVLILFVTTAINVYTWKESFIPRAFKEQYRPLERNIRMGVEGMYVSSTTAMSNWLRKAGIM